MPQFFEIHPSIGIARLGTSRDFFIGPEPGGTPPAAYRDGAGDLLRQAARFRVFDCQRDQQGVLLSATEITPAQGQISWTVRVMNRKGSAPNFAKPGGRRRNHATGNDAADAALIVDPGARTLTGPSQGPALFGGGMFKGTPVTLGEMRTDAAGRLVVAGGFGKSDSVPPQPNPSAPLQGFADSDNWYDDTSDGPVQATLQLAGGGTPAVKPAWVIVAPPDFAPEIQNIVTLYDAALQAAVTGNLARPPAQISFSRHILPILSRAVGYQWVNKFSRLGHSGARPGNFLQNLAAMASTNPPPPEARVLLRRLRDASTTPPGAAPEPNKRSWMPRLFQELDSDPSGNLVLPLTALQYAALQHWAAGTFVNDLGLPQPAEPLPDALDRVALEAASGGAFYPGIECGSIMRDPTIYSEPFRIDPARVTPGQLTQGNALPWQADFYACSWDPQQFLGWWPAQRPDHVLTAASPNTPTDWIRGINDDLDLVSRWHLLGIVVKQIDAAGHVTYRESERLLP
jgi:hypothetical protein